MEAIYGIINFDCEKKVRLDELRDMGKFLSEPEKIQIWNGCNVGFAGMVNDAFDNAARRLIAEDNDKSIIAVFNGEIHNSKELKKELMVEYSVKSIGDSELVVHLYKKYGDLFPSKINGLFCLALWDSMQKKLLLAIDRFGGIRQLIYADVKNSIIFGSAFRAILGDSRITRTVNLDAIDTLLNFRYIHGEDTIFKNIKRLMPAHVLIVKDSKVMIKRYWDWDFGENQNGYKRPAEIYDVFKEAVRIRLNDNEKIGSFLSGGLDSSTTVGIIRELTKSRWMTFLAAFDDPGLSESGFADLVSGYCKTEHHVVLTKSEDIELLPQMLWALEEPFCDAAFIPSWLVCKLAKEKVDFIISADGSDQLFGRYSWFARDIQLFENIPFSKLIKKIIINTNLSNSGNILIRKIAEIAQYSHRPLSEVYRDNFSCVSSEERQKLYSSDFLKHVRTNRDGESNFVRKNNRVNELIYIDANASGSFDDIAKWGRMANAHSLVIREPFLDTQLVEFINGLPLKYKYSLSLLAILRRKKETKVALRKYVSSRVAPEVIWKQKKHGFLSPINYWLKDNYLEHAKRIVLSKKAKQRGYFNPGYLDEIFEQYKKSNSEKIELIFMLVILELWHRIYIDNSTITNPSFNFSMA